MGGLIDMEIQELGYFRENLPEPQKIKGEWVSYD